MASVITEGMLNTWRKPVVENPLTTRPRKYISLPGKVKYKMSCICRFQRTYDAAHCDQLQSQQKTISTKDNTSKFYACN
jgi:hypothetical protein